MFSSLALDEGLKFKPIMARPLLPPTKVPTNRQQRSGCSGVPYLPATRKVPTKRQVQTPTIPRAAEYPVHKPVKQPDRQSPLPDFLSGRCPIRCNQWWKRCFDCTKSCFVCTKSCFVPTKQRLDDTKQRLDDTKQRLDDTNQRLDDTKQRLDDTKQRLDNTKQRYTDIIGCNLTGNREGAIACQDACRDYGLGETKLVLAIGNLGLLSNLCFQGCIRRILCLILCRDFLPSPY